MSELQEHASPIVLCCGTERALFTNKLSNIDVKSLYSTSLQTFVHVRIQVIKLQEHACRILKKEMLTQMSPNSITSPSFRCWVREIPTF